MNASSEIDRKEFWIGRHSADGDMLVFDPENDHRDSPNLYFFSLTQFRERAFPPAVVKAKISELTDPELYEQARGRYRQWPELKAEHDREVVHASERARTEADERRREYAIEQHRAFLADRNVPYAGLRAPGEGVRVSGAKGKKSKRRRTSCYVCHSDLDNGVAAECVACEHAICSCGACGCGYAGRQNTA